MSKIWETVTQVFNRVGKRQEGCPIIHQSAKEVSQLIKYICRGSQLHDSTHLLKRNKNRSIKECSW